MKELIEQLRAIAERERTQYSNPGTEAIEITPADGITLDQLDSVIAALQKSLS